MSQSNCPQTLPYEITLEEGKPYFWCTCGLSKSQPFCDGAHKGSGFKSHCFTPEEKKRVWLCGCKKTKNPPYCDGSHETL